MTKKLIYILKLIESNAMNKFPEMKLVLNGKQHQQQQPKIKLCLIISATEKKKKKKLTKQSYQQSASIKKLLIKAISFRFEIFLIIYATTN